MSFLAFRGEKGCWTCLDLGGREVLGRAFLLLGDYALTGVRLTTNLELVRTRGI